MRTALWWLMATGALLFNSCTGRRLAESGTVDALSKSTVAATSETLSAQVVDAVLRDGFKVNVKDASCIWLEMKGFDEQVPESVGGVKVKVFNSEVSDPFDGEESWANRPLVLYVNCVRQSEETMTLDVIRRFGSSDLRRTLELTRSPTGLRVTKIISSGVGRR